MHKAIVGSTVRVELPYSEACMCLRVAGKTMNVKVLEHNAAQLMDDDGIPFSFPITHGEAGIQIITHVDYPHQPGYLYDCPACEAQCHCEGTQDSSCVYHAL